MATKFHLLWKIQNIPVLQNHNSQVSDPSIVEFSLAEWSLSWHLLQPGPQAETTMGPEDNRFAAHHQPMQSSAPKGKKGSMLKQPQEFSLE